MPAAAESLSLGPFSTFVEARLGLSFPVERWSDLDRGLRATAMELGFSEPEECAAWLMSERCTRREMDVLATHLTIGETYFFRDPHAFELLEKEVLPELIRERASGAKRLRIWSAGCCTGEEPYSIAIALQRVLPDLRGWQVTILATDLNPRFLQKAAAGVYTRWAFRSMPDAERARYFDEVEPGRFAIDPRLKEMVTFAPLNLVADMYPSLASNTNAIDIIFCRNVLMYFSRECARRVILQLHRSAMEGAWFFASAAEATPELFAPFVRGEYSGAAIYRKFSDTVAKPTVVVAPIRSQPAAATRKIEPPPLPEDHASIARTLANEGRLADALAACEQALALNKLDPANHYLRGMILQESGSFEEAIAALRRALFLDSKFVLAHFALGNLAQRRSPAEAERHFENARALLRQYDPETTLPQSEGITAGRLLAILSSSEEARA